MGTTEKKKKPTDIIACTVWTHNYTWDNGVFSSALFDAKWATSTTSRDIVTFNTNKDKSVPNYIKISSFLLNYKQKSEFELKWTLFELNPVFLTE